MAIRYYKPGSTAWSLAASWATTIGGTDSAAAAPTSADDVTFDSNSGTTCSVAAVSACKTLTCTGWLGTINTTSGANTLTISGNTTLGTGSTHSGSGAMIINATATLTSNANSRITCPVTFSGSAITLTLADDWTINGLFSTNPSTGTITINSNNIYCKGGISINTSASSTALTTGTTNINITGAGSIITTTNTSGGLGNNFTINAPGATVTFATGNIYYKTGTFKYIAGNLSGTSTLQITGTCSLDMNAGLLNYVTPLSIQAQAAATITMLSDWYLSAISFSFAMTINGFSLFSTGTISITSAGISGTTVIRLKGAVAGQSVSSSATIGNDITIEAGSNTVNIANLFVTPRSGGQTITYTSGTVNNSGTLTVAGTNPITFNTAGVTWNNITYTNVSITSTLNSLLSLSGILTLTGSSTGTAVNYTFSGSFGFSTGTLTNISSPSLNTGILLSAGATYTVTSALNLYSTTAPTYLGLKSGTTGSTAYFNLNKGATQVVGNIQVTDIDSSGGQTIWAWRPGTLSNTVNWRTLTSANVQKGITFIN